MKATPPGAHTPNGVLIPNLQGGQGPMDDPNPTFESVEPDADEPRSYALDYVLLDRSASDDPVWVLVRYEAVRAADLDDVGNPSAVDQLHMLQWATEKLMKVVNPRPVPGGDRLLFRLEDGEEG